MAALTDAVRLDHVHAYAARTFIINWCLSSVCNYACSYCPDHLHDRAIRFPPVETVVRLLREVKAQRPGHRIAFDLSGGEVTAWPELLECLRALKQEGALVSILTNGSRPLPWWEKAVGLLDKVVLSFHSEFASFDHALELVHLLRTRVMLHVNVLMHPRRFSQCLEAARIFSELDDLSLALQPVLREINDPQSVLVNYTRDQLEIVQNQSRHLRELRFTRAFDDFRGPLFLADVEGRRRVCTPQEILASGANRWRGWACSMGLQQIAVYLDGSVMGGWCRQGPQLGNVNQGGIRLPPSPILCGADSCFCYYDIQCSKQRTDVAQPSSTMPSALDDPGRHLKRSSR